MARRKNYYAFTDFNYTDGASELFNNTIRNAFEYDAYTSDVFQARVIHKAPSSIKGKFIYRIRILGNLSPHRFIEDPCELSDAIVEEQKQIFNNLLSLHTKLISTTSLNKYDIIRVSLERSGQAFNLVETNQLIEVVTPAKELNLEGKLVSTIQGEDRRYFDKCEDLFQKASKFNEGGTGETPPTPIGQPLNQAELDRLMNKFYGAFREYLISNGYKAEDIGNGSRSRTTLEGRQMIMRFGLEYNLPEVTTFINNNKAQYDAVEGKKFSNFDDSVLTKEFTESIRVKLKSKGLKIAQPERSSHNPNNGFIAMDFQLLNQNTPSFGFLVSLAESFKYDPLYETTGLTIENIIPEPTNGNAKCGTGKCGVVHIDMLPSDAVSAEYMRNYSTVNPYVEVSEDQYVDPGIQDEIDQLYPPEPTVPNPFGETEIELEGESPV